MRSDVWRGRLGELDPRARRLNESLPVDHRLWPEELALSRAYAVSLVEAGVMSAAECSALHQACESLERELEAGTHARPGADGPTPVEAELTRRCGDPRRQQHTGRSRNDQVATLMRMRVRDLCEAAIEHVRELELALFAQANAAGAQPIAATTHVQPAQPILLAHWWLAHLAAFERDEERFLAAREAADRLPLGAGAVAGSPLRYDRAALAMRLQFSRLAENSLDAVGDRDFALEYLNAAAALGIHLSRLAEDLVLACAPSGWAIAPDGFSTGSSLLPQKRNPDVFELARAKSARLIANAQRLAVLLKGLPSSYQKDLQEDKEAVFDTADTIAVLLGALAPAIHALRPDAVKLDAALTPDLLAVELADALVAEGVPFREAHAQVGALWAAAEQAAVPPRDLPEPDRLALSPHFTDARLASLTVASALARRDHAPGGGASSVQAQLERHGERLGVPAGYGVAQGSTAPNKAKTRTGKARSEATAPEEGFPQNDASAGAGGSRSGPRATEREPGTAERRGEEREVRQDGGPERVRGAEPPAAADRPVTSTDADRIDSSTDDNVTIRRASLDDVPGIAAIMADYVLQGVLLSRPVSELYQCVREFHVAEHRGANGAEPQIVACAALRVLWADLGEVRSLAVRPDHHGQGLGARLVAAVLEDARALALPRVIALTREVPFFERCGFTVAARDTMPRKVWTDCVRCPRRHACDEVAVVLDLVPGASEAAAAAGRSWSLPLPPPLRDGEVSLLPIIS